MNKLVNITELRLSVCQSVTHGAANSSNNPCDNPEDAVNAAYSDPRIPH